MSNVHYLPVPASKSSPTTGRAPRRVFLICFAALVLPFVAMLSSCFPKLTADDKAQIARDAVYIAVCQSKGLDCKAEDAGNCREVYEECMRGHGLRDAGVE